MTTKVLCFEGTSCSGKSTTVEAIINTHDNFFLLNKDNLKWNLSNYESGNPEQEAFFTDMIIDMAKNCIQHNISIIIEGRKEVVEQLQKKDIGNTELYYFNIEAPWEVIEQRFNERMKSVNKNGNKVSNKSIDRLQQMFDTYHTTGKYEHATTFDTSKLTTGEILKQIEKVVGL